MNTAAKRNTSLRRPALPWPVSEHWIARNYSVNYPGTKHYKHSAPKVALPIIYSSSDETVLYLHTRCKLNTHMGMTQQMMKKGPSATIVLKSAGN
jgi:hypothetical protein